MGEYIYELLKCPSPDCAATWDGRQLDLSKLHKVPEHTRVNGKLDYYGFCLGSGESVKVTVYDRLPE